MMNDLIIHKKHFDEVGYAIIVDVYNEIEIAAIKKIVAEADTSKSTFRKSGDLFAIRQFLKEIPVVVSLIFNKKLGTLIKTLFGNDYFVTKSIYFDKPGTSNWYVAYHQDLTISVDKKTNAEGFGPWTVKQNKFAVQPPVEFLQDNFTVRIHLDDTDEGNAALRVIPGSHNEGVWRMNAVNLAEQKEEVCKVPAGGVMFMHPLLMHASGRSTNNKQRRVIHIEFSNKKLPGDLNWSEQLFLN